MAATQRITKVWIEEGCIVCDACETTSPDVFHVIDDTCIVRPEALSPDFTKPRSEEIIDAAEECPVDVIKFESVTEEVPDEAVLAAVVATEDSEKPAATDEPTPVSDGEAVTAASAAAKAPTGVAPDAAPQRPAAGVADPGIQALLRAATARGGDAGLARNTDPAPQAVQEWRRKNPSELPPDALQVKMYKAAQAARKDPDAQRRAFVSNAALAAGWVAFGGGLGLSVGPALGRFMMPNVLEEPDPRVRAGKINIYAEMAPGDVNEDYKPQGIWIIREADRIAALSIICTHLGCIPNWLPNDRKFKCPCHGSGYRANGINFEGPTPRPLERFRLFIDNGIVIVDKSKKYQFELGQWDQPGSYLEI